MWNLNIFIDNETCLIQQKLELFITKTYGGTKLKLLNDLYLSARRQNIKLYQVDIEQ